MAVREPKTRSLESRVKLAKQKDQPSVFGVGVVSPLYLLHCEKCQQPLVVALVWENEGQALNDPALPGIESHCRVG